MNSPLNSWLTKQERETVVPKEGRNALREQMFGTPSRWRWIALLFPVTIAAAAVFLFVSPQKNILTPQEVLAAVSAEHTLPAGSVEKISVTSTLSDGRTFSASVLTDGTRYLIPQTPDDGTKADPTWVQKNGDHLTMTQYIKTSKGVARWLEGDMTFYDETRGDIDGWQNASPINLCENDSCNPANLDLNTQANIVMTQETQPDGTAVYRLTSEDAPPDTQSFHSNPPPVFIRRTNIIRASDFRLLSHAWTAEMDDGRTLTGEMKYTYETISAEQLGHPFTLEWWLSSVDPEAKAAIYCAAYSSATCADATKKTEQHEPQYIPEGWLNDPALGSRKQILTAE